jgi:hypothetical protein
MADWRHFPVNAIRDNPAPGAGSTWAASRSSVIRKPGVVMLLHAEVPRGLRTATAHRSRATLDFCVCRT